MSLSELAIFKYIYKLIFSEAFHDRKNSFLLVIVNRHWYFCPSYAVTAFAKHFIL